MRLARTTGYRLQVRELIKQALRSNARSRDLEELRREAVACMGDALFDADQFERRLFMRGDIPAGVAFSQDDEVLAIAAEKLGILRLWDVAVNREVAVLDCPHASGALTFTPDGRYLIASSGEAVRLWTPWETSEKVTLHGHAGGIPGIASNRDGTLLASAGKDRTVRIWDAARGRLIKTFSDFRGPAQAVAFTPDGGRLVTAEPIRPGHLTQRSRFLSAATGSPRRIGP
jgi:WD40 repeat protein